MASSSSSPRLAFFCATFLPEEAHHIYRQIRLLDAWDPRVLTWKRRNETTFPFDALLEVPRSPLRQIGRMREQLSGRPWQLTSGETRELLRILERERVHLLHIFLGNVAIHCLPLLRSSPIPVIASFHGADVAGTMASPRYRHDLQELFGLARLICCRSEDLKQRLVALGCPPEKVRLQRTVIPGLQRAAQPAPPDGSWRLLQAGRLIPKKGYRTTLRAFRLVLESLPNARLAIAGDGPERASLQIEAEHLGIEHSLEFLGFLDARRLEEEYRKAHLFLHPSEAFEGDTEGIPNALLEAMAAGLPVVATHHGGIPEVVRSGRNGLLVPESSPRMLAEAILEMVSDSARREALAREAVASIQAEYSEAARRPSIEGVYLEALQTAR